MNTFEKEVASDGLMIRGKKTVCRPLELHDQAFVVELSNDPVVRHNVVGWDFPMSLHEQVRWFQSDSSDRTQRWLVSDTSGCALGLTGLWDIDRHNRNALTAIKLGGPSQRRGQGYGTDAILAVMAYAFYEVGLERLYSSILSYNAPSLTAYTKHCGWLVEGVARRHIWRQGSFVDLLHIGVLRSDFDLHPEAEAYRGLLSDPN